MERHFGGRDKAISALGIYRQLWEHWQKTGIPKGRQFQIEVVTRGKLKADRPTKAITVSGTLARRKAKK